MPNDRDFPVGKSLLFGCIVTLAMVVIAEVGVRTWAHYFRGIYERYDPDSEAFELVPGEYRFGSAILRINSDGFVGDELPADLADSVRVFAVGDSCTFGDADYRTAYPALLEDLLRASGVAARVVNGGVEGLNSEMALRRFRAKSPLVRPDVVIIYIGWNDLMKNSPTAQAGGGWLASAAAALDQLWLTKGLRKLVFFYIRPWILPPEVAPEGYTGVFKDFEPDTYNRNLIELVRAAREQGARPILVTLPSILDKSLTLADLRAGNVAFPYFPEANHLYDFMELVQAYNRVIRRVADQERVQLVDLAAHFDGLGDKRGYFYDTMHANRAGRQIIASVLKDSVLQAATKMPVQ